MKVWDRVGIELMTPGSAVRLPSLARHVTDCATRPGMCLFWWQNLCSMMKLHTQHNVLTFFLLSAGVDTEHIVRIWACLIPAITGLHLLGGTRAWEGQISGFITGGSTNMIICFFGPRLQM